MRREEELARVHLNYNAGSRPYVRLLIPSLAAEDDFRRPVLSRVDGGGMVILLKSSSSEINDFDVVSLRRSVIIKRVVCVLRERLQLFGLLTLP